MKVLFVCLGNICRSSMAEAMFREEVKDFSIEVDSAGTSSWNKGKAPHVGTKKILDSLNIPYDNMYSRQVHQDDFKDFDYIFAMDLENLKDLKRMAKEKYHHKIYLLLDILQDANIKEVPDPWHTGDFQETRDLISQANQLWVKKIKPQL